MHNSADPIDSLKDGDSEEQPDVPADLREHAQRGVEVDLLIDQDSAGEIEELAAHVLDGEVLKVLRAHVDEEEPAGLKTSLLLIHRVAVMQLPSDARLVGRPADVGLIGDPGAGASDLVHHDLPQFGH